MKKIKSLNGYTIYEATKRDENKYNVEAGMFYIYFSSDVREYGISNSDYDWEAGTIEEAEDFCNGTNYAKAKEIAEETTTCATYEEIEKIEKMLDSETFGEFLNNTEWIDTEIIIDGCEMEFSFVWDNDYTFTEYGKELYKDILNAKYEVTEKYIEVFGGSEKLGDDFVATIAGYTPEERYNKIIIKK